MELTKEQERAKRVIVDLINSKKPITTLGGYAGTGKSTLIKFIVNHFCDKRIAFCAFTGKASSVLKSKVNTNMKDDDFCGTVHSLIYTLVGEDENNIMHFELKDYINYDLIIVDEASMLNQQLFVDLTSFGIPILAVGDHGQLPPIGKGLNLMAKPDITLEKILRQMEGNPIIKVSEMARKDGFIPLGKYGDTVQKIKGIERLRLVKSLNDVMVLCGRNRTRRFANILARESFGLNYPSPLSGEKVICLRNNRYKGVYNGNVGLIETIKDIGEFAYQVSILMETGVYFKGQIYKDQFLCEKTCQEIKFFNLFDYAYCLTVHKSQGSEYDNVILLEERNRYMTDDEWSRWLYTGVTRAKNKLLILGE